MLKPIIIFALGFAPGLFWMWYIYRKDKHAPEPVRLIINVFILGMVSCLLALVLEIYIPQIFPGINISENSGNPLYLTLHYIFFVGGIEEFCKLLPVWLYVYRKQEFNEVIDGVVYSSAAALGFATLENVFYIISHGPSVMLGRAILSTLGHLLDSAFWGLGFGLAKFNPKYSKYIIIVGFIISIIAHGLYDVFVYSLEILLVLVLLLAAWKILLVIIDKSNLLSPFKHNWARKMIICPNCSQMTRKNSKFCAACGKEITVSNDAKYFCGHCLKEAQKEKNWCGSCGYCLLDI